MDPNLLAFGLSACFTMIAYFIIMAFINGRRPPGSEDRPSGPVTVGV